MLDNGRKRVKIHHFRPLSCKLIYQLPDPVDAIDYL